MIKNEFFDAVNYAICRAVNRHLEEQATEFFRTVGEFHLQEALRQGLLCFQSEDSPLDRLCKVARYLEACGYMERIVIEKLSATEAIVEMHGVTVSASSAALLREGRQPSHYMTNLMFAVLREQSIQAELQDMEYDAEAARFKEHWRILGSVPPFRGTSDAS